MGLCHISLNVLFMFDKEIKLQASLDTEKKKMQKHNNLDTLYKNRKEELTGQIAQLKNELNQKYADVNKARQNYIAESDGTGGTGKIGIKDIALAKKKEYEKLDVGYQPLV